MSTTNAMRDEGAAYLAALKLKEKFQPNAADINPDQINQNIANLALLQESFQGCLDKIQDEELVKEVTPFNKEIKNYLLLLKSLAEKLATQDQAAEIYRYFLDPKADMAIPPHAEAREVRKQLLRLAGFSDPARILIEESLALREQYETNKLFSASNRLKQKSEGGKFSGFFKKMGI